MKFAKLHSQPNKVVLQFCLNKWNNENKLVHLKTQLTFAGYPFSKKMSIFLYNYVWCVTLYWHFSCQMPYHLTLYIAIRSQLIQHKTSCCYYFTTILVKWYFTPTRPITGTWQCVISKPILEKHKCQGLIPSHHVHKMIQDFLDTLLIYIRFNRDSMHLVSLRGDDTLHIHITVWKDSAICLG